MNRRHYQLVCEHYARKPNTDNRGNVTYAPHTDLEPDTVTRARFAGPMKTGEAKVPGQTSRVIATVHILPDIGDVMIGDVIRLNGEDWTVRSVLNDKRNAPRAVAHLSLEISREVEGPHG